MTPFSLINKNIIITGASSGLGQNCAIECSKLGATLFLIGRSIKGLESTRSKCIDSHKHQVICCDLLDIERLKEIFNNLSANVQFHGLVNFAGISLTLPFRNTNESKLMQVFNANIQTAVNISKIAIKGVKGDQSTGFSLVFIGSIMGVVGESGKFIYGMSKAALIGGVKSLAVELAPKKIRVNIVSPGWIKTPMTENQYYASQSNAIDLLINKHPLGAGNPEDVSWACIYLLSDASKWVTGTNLIIDGGYTSI